MEADANSSETHSGQEEVNRNRSKVAMPEKCHFLLHSLPLEAAFIVCMLVSFCIGSILVCSNGHIHGDEPMVADTSINIATGIGNINNAHDTLVPGHPVATSAPSHQYSLALWVKIFGFSRSSVIAFNCVIVAFVAFTFWVALVRTPKCFPPSCRLLLIAFVTLSPATYAVYAINRYDCVGILGLALAYLAHTFRSDPIRLISLAATGVLVGLSGLHVSLAGLLMALAYMLRLRLGGLSEGGSFVAGLLTSASITFWRVSEAGLDKRATPDLAERLERFLSHELVEFIRIPLVGGNGLLYLSLFIVVLFIAKDSLVAAVKSIACAGILTGLWISYSLEFLAIFYHRYAWLAAFPMVLCLLWSLGDISKYKSAKFTILLMITVFIAKGLPLGGLKAASEWDERRYHRVQTYLEQFIRTDDTVYSTYLGYYPVKKLSRDSYFGAAFDHLDPTQLASLNLMILEEKPRHPFEPTIEEALQSAGGNWQLQGEFQQKRGAIRELIPPTPKESHIFNISVFRRVPNQEN